MKKSPSIVLVSLLFLFLSCGSDDEGKLPISEFVLGVWEVSRLEVTTIDFVNKVKTKQIKNFSDGTLLSQKSDGELTIKDLTKELICVSKDKYKFSPNHLIIAKNEFKSDKCIARSKDTLQWSVNEDDDLLEYSDRKFKISRDSDKMVLTEETAVKRKDYTERKLVIIELLKI